MDTADGDERTKLLIARGEIEAILRKHDICAHVVLGGIGRLEAIVHLDASWSKVFLFEDEHGQGLRLRSKKADYQGDTERQRHDLEATVGMVSGVAGLLGAAALGWLEVSEQFDKATGAEHTPMKRDRPQ